MKGYRTYLTVAVGVVVSGLYAMGYISQDTFNAIASLAGFAGLGFLRAAKQTVTLVPLMPGTVQAQYQPEDSAVSSASQPQA
jgi:hypothetical protein